MTKRFIILQVITVVELTMILGYLVYMHLTGVCIKP
jgi:hypothetical protein